MKPDMNARVSQLHKTEKEWNLLTKFIPFQGEFIIFDPDQSHAYARLKIGDGKTLLKDLPFFIDSAIDDHVTKRQYNEVIDGGRIINYKK
jgi:hypothetical protein